LISESFLYIIEEILTNIICLLGVYVDGILISGIYSEILNTKNKIKENFKIKEIGDINFMIGIKFIKHKHGYFLSQSRYLLELLEKYDMINSYPIRNLQPIEDKVHCKNPVNET